MAQRTCEMPVPWRGKTRVAVVQRGTTVSVEVLRAAFWSLAFNSALALTARAQEPEIRVELGRPEIYLGESVRYTVLLNLFDEDAKPAFPESTDFALREVGKSVQSSMSTTMINGRVRRVVESGPKYVYELVPKRAGVISIPGPTAELDGKTIRGDRLTVRVIAVSEQDLVRLRLSAEPSSIYPTQSFVVRVEVAVKGLPDFAKDRNPLTVQTLPTLAIPWADDKTLPDGVEPAEPFDRWIQQLRPSRDRGGLSINNLQARSNLSDLLGGDPFDMLRDDFFGRRRRSDNRVGFHPEPSRVRENDLRGMDAEYWKYSFDRRFVAQKFGSYSFGPVTLKGDFGSRLNTDGKLEGESVYAMAEPIEVVVRQPPSEGQPAEYIGAIGSFRCGATIAPSEAKVGDPMTLSLWIRGQGTLAHAEAPELQDIPEIDQQFKIYDATEDLQADMQTFTYSLRPKHAEIEAFPAVAMAYFDVDREQYVTLRTDPLPIDVGPAEALQKNEIAVASQSSRLAPELEASEGGIFANVEDLGELHDETVHPDRWFLGLGGMAGLFLVVVVARQRIEKRLGDTGLIRRRRAAARARREIDAVLSDPHSNDALSAADRISQALIGLIADASDLQESGLTSKDVTARLREFQVEQGIIERCREVLESCDAIRYGSTAGSLEELADQAQELVEVLIRALRQAKRLP